eukprot:1888489-Amphidinium_carterae.1
MLAKQERGLSRPRQESFPLEEARRLTDQAPQKIVYFNCFGGLRGFAWPGASLRLAAWVQSTPMPVPYSKLLPRSRGSYKGGKL